jgi:pimeloyl-ACP methyl ester carboxylesterase
MKKVIPALVTIAAVISMAPPASADTLYLRGKMAKNDGSPPGKLVQIEQLCDGRFPTVVATTGKSGDYLWRAQGDSLGLDILKPVRTSGSRELGIRECVLRAELPGYDSTILDLSNRNLFKEPRLPLLVLTPKRPGQDVGLDPSAAIPDSIRKTWTLAENAMSAENWPEAEHHLRAATAAEPKFRLGWVALGLACQSQKMSTQARDAYRRAVALDPKPLRPQLLLVRANMDCQDWPEASRTADALIAADASHTYLEAYLYHAIALYLLRDMERAVARARELLQLDKAHRIPRAEYVLGLILQERKDFAAAREHMGNTSSCSPTPPTRPPCGRASKVSASRRRPPRSQKSARLI